MQRNWLFALVGAAALHAWPGTAASSQNISLDECLKLALEHNLDLQIQRISPRLAQLALDATYAAYDPQFRASYKHDSATTPGGIDSEGRPYEGTSTANDNIQMGLAGLGPRGFTYSLGGNATATDYTEGLRSALPTWASGSVGISMTQPLLKGFVVDEARYYIAVQRKNTRISQLGLEQKVMQTVRDVQVAYYSLIAGIEAVKVQEQALTLAEQQLAENKKRVEVGVMAPLDEKEAESLVAASRASLLQTQNALKTRQNALKALLTDKYTDWVETELLPTEKLLATPMTFSRPDSWSKALSKRPELLQARLDIERRNIVLKYDRSQLLPQLDLNGSYALGGSGQEFSGALDAVTTRDSPSYSVGASFTMPLWNRRARTTYRSSKLEKEQALLSLKKLEQDIMVAVDDAISQAQSSLEQVRARRQAVEHALAAYEAEQKKLDNGKSTSFQVLSYQNALTEARYQELFARNTYTQAVIDLAFIEGSLLEQNGIVLGQHGFEMGPQTPTRE